MKLKKKVLLTACLALLALGAHADFETELNQKYPATKGSKVQRAFDGFYSIVRGQDVVFIRDDFSVLINGEVTDLKSQVSLSGMLRDANKPKIDASLIDTKNAIQFGSGRRKLFVFSDPDCPYCQQLEKSLAQLEDTTVYVLPFPLTGLHPNAQVIAESIWCAKDKSAVWRDYLLLGKKPKVANCPNPIDKNIALAGEFQIQGTPAILFEDGTLVPGAIPLDRIEAQLNASRAILESKK